MARLRPPSGTKIALLATIIAVACTVGFVHQVVGTRAPANSPAIPTVSAVAPAPCNGARSAVAVARTATSLVTICADRNGGYVYHGVRLSDGAVLDVPAESTGARRFVARNDKVTYSLSPEQLVVTKDNAVVRQEPVTEYRVPQS